MNRSILGKYFFKELLISTLGNTFVLTCILLYGNLQKHGDLLIQSFTFSPTSFVELIGYLIPYSLSMGLPFGFALAILFSLGRMASQGEIVALNSHGVGLLQWALPVFFLAFCLSIVSTFAQVDWAPKNRTLFDARQKEIVWSNLNHLLLQKGQVEFEVDSKGATPGLEGIGQLADEGISKISISVGKIQSDVWKNVRIVMKQDDGAISSVLHAGEATTTRSDDQRNLILNLTDVDVEPGFSEERKSNNRSSFFVSFRKWKYPIVINLFSSHQTLKNTWKRMGLLELITVLGETKDTATKKEVKTIISKGFALGLSPFFLCFFLLPIASQKGKRETMINMTCGIFVCLGYFGLGQLSFNLLSNLSFAYFGWWIPNLVSLLLGLIFIKRLLMVGN
ncbi:MAG: LptF/LptG family permease [Opitutales bacterium]|nr:LptF/LptG family permease [Opitutales bacterium]